MGTMLQQIQPNVWVRDPSILLPRPFTSEIRLDNTKRSSFVECRRKFFLAHIMNITSKNGSTSLRYGSTWHGMMEGFYTGIKIYGWKGRDKAIEMALLNGQKVWDRETGNKIFFTDYRTLEACCNMFIQYIQHFSYDENMLEVVESEQVFACPMEIKTEKEKRTFGHLPPVVFTGKIDLQVLLNSIKWFIEFKTTGFALDTQVMRLNRSPQVIGYTYAAPIVLGFTPQGALVSFAYTYSRKNKDGVYGKLTIDFQRAPQIFAPQDMENWKESFLNTAKDIYEAYKTKNFPMEFGSCYNYNKACQFTRICEGNRNVTEMSTNDILDFYPDFCEHAWDVEAEGGMVEEAA